MTLEARFDLSKISGCTFGEYIDPHYMCRLMRTIEFFERFRCSDEMGYAYGESGGRRIHAFQGGKIIVRRAEDEADARRILRALGRVLWGSVKCDCGHAMVHCLSGACDDCLDDVCGCQLEPPMEGGKSEGRLNGWEVLDFAQSLEHGDKYRSAAQHLRQAGEKLVKLTEMLSHGKGGLARLENEVRAHCVEVGRLATSFLIETDNGYHAGLGFLLHGVALNILAGLEALIALSGKEAQEGLSRVSAFIDECFISLFESRHENLERIETERENIVKDLPDDDVVTIVDAGFHTARVLRKVFPK
ncbi:MAG: hypothetical protein KAU99_01315 [Thermoplasmata archaeon]|nr:hypothetical protein [Thermoplasmata archaeon]